ncbi:hypothetical protein NQ314_010404 [Rhamnusium bicolor]|uniref:Glucose-methanol-choline oxidoreductase N-terminal domain-containing protein n=1 Tax=Rhamnusium bicolor TaxID=1586634 RepID=A0AAV8XS81_9CUCU|nr:hypothetical protein NQ314_010404 [Rhamnusium bicolor]
MMFMIMRRRMRDEGGEGGGCYSSETLDYYENLIRSERKKAENFKLPTSAQRYKPNDDGPPTGKGLLNVEYSTPRSEQCKVFLKANEQLGYNLTDFNGPEEIGASPYQINIKEGKRQDSGTAFLKPFLNRPNLKILTKSFVMKIIINKSKEAEGVIFTYKGRKYKAKATKEVIVCEGSINSPQLLMLSGIGPEEHLKQHVKFYLLTSIIKILVDTFLKITGIPVIENLEVGSTLTDHLQFYGLTFSSNLTEPVKSLRQYVKDYLNGQGILTEALTQQCASYVQTKLEKNPTYPDFEIDFYNSNSTSPALLRGLRWKKEVSEAISGVNLASSFSIYLAILDTKSFGTVRLKSSSPFDYPLIDSNCLSDPKGEDILRTYEAVQITLKMIETDAFRKINAKLESKPLKFCSKYKFLTKDYWYCALRYLTGHDNHPASSCKMGPDPKKGYVVDSELRVHGIGKLSVADASVIPIATSAHINAICYMIGEKLADILKARYQ